MTSKTGKTEMTERGTIDPPAWWQAMFGAVAQCGTVTYVWTKYTSFSSCAAGDFDGCLSDPWARTALFTYSFALFMWLLSLRSIPSTGTSDPSIVDRLWSIMPWLYVWHLAISTPGPRVLLMAVLSTVWGVRLSYNFYIKGGFSGGEDYRWGVIRTWFPKGFKWESFNLCFICFCQQLIVLAFSSPAAIAAASDAPLNLIDAFAALLYTALLLGEAVADRQMFVFQTEKYRRIGAKQPLGPAYEHGFIETGLWAFSRHPNYFCEVSMWWAFYLFSVAASGQLLNWALVGPIFLTGLFTLPRASLDVTEALSSRKYPAYEAYQQRVSRFLPLPPKSGSLGASAPLLLGWFAVGVGAAIALQSEGLLTSAVRLSLGVPARV